jgi:hypothetical protein
MNLLFILICVHGDISEVSIYVELYEGEESMQSVRCHVREKFDRPFQLEIVCMEDHIQMPLFSHIARVP